MKADELDDFYAMIWDCQNRDKKLNEWERWFIDSIHEQFGKTGWLSSRQIDKLNLIWERVTMEG